MISNKTTIIKINLIKVSKETAFALVGKQPAEEHWWSNKYRKDMNFIWRQLNALETLLIKLCSLNS
jgi:hypothetical protein